VSLKRKMIIGLVSLLGAYAFAEDNANPVTSEFQHQANAGVWEVTPGMSFGNFKTNYGSGNTLQLSSSTDAMTSEFIKGEYGINEMFAVGVQLAYQTDNITYSPSQAGGTAITKIDGMNDPVIYFLGRNDVGYGSIHYGLNFDFAVDKGQINTTSMNEASGGLTFTPFVGYEFGIGPGILGAKASYDIRTNRSYEDNRGNNGTSSLTLKDGQAFTIMAFYEWNLDPVVWGLDLGLVNRTADHFTENGKSGSLNNGSNNFNISTYANWTVIPMVHILPSIGYGILPQGFPSTMVANGGINTIAGMFGTVAVRLAF
jgi:hypothetical protein